MNNNSSAAVPNAVPRYRLADTQTGEQYDIDADDLVRIVGVELAFIDCAISSDGAFKNGLWIVEQS